jgi:hypothetical protein
LFVWARAGRERPGSLFRQLAGKWRHSTARRHDDFAAESFARTRQWLAMYESARISVRRHDDGPLIWRN